MCGLVAFYGARCDPALLDVLVQLARTRGPDAWGWAWSDGAALTLRRVTTLGDLSFSWPGVSTRVRVFVGHARLATSGTLAEGDAHPLPLVQYPLAVFAHNGTVYHPDVLARRYHVTCDVACDSLVLGQLWWQTQQADTTWQTLVAHQGMTPHAWLAATATRLWWAAWGQPLHRRVTPEGTYLCSRRFDGSAPVRPFTHGTWEVP